ncbi:hypothetical protein HYV50_03850 [Candidatus Pacearchaeota archaeon]|nr:hypothetical protein [Candidatus Pacearchaeota archaeon]
MIEGRKPLMLAEVFEIVKDIEDKKPLHEYLKKFSKLSKDRAVKLNEEIISLNNPKIKEENIIKVADFLPQTPEEVNKIFTEITLTEGEINAILEIVKKY